MTAGVWQHVAVVMYGPQVKLYLDGLVVAEANAFPIQASSNLVSIGAVLSTDQSGARLLPFHGLMGRLRIWNVTHYQFQIFQDAILWDVSTIALPTLQAYYDFTALPATEISGNHLQFKFTDGVTNCLLIPGVSFDGPGFINVGHGPDLALGGTRSYTIDGWFMEPGVSTGSFVAKALDQSQWEYRVRQIERVLYGYRGNASLNSGPFRIQDNKWQHFAMSEAEVADLMVGLTQWALGLILHRQQFPTACPST